MLIALYIITSLVGAFIVTYFILRGIILNRDSSYYPSPHNIGFTRGRKRIVCAGDSITRGNLGENWVAKIAKTFPQYAFFNAGINSDLTYTLLSRWDEIIAVKPDFVTILIGTNDVNATMHAKKEKRYRKMNKVTKTPTYKDFRDNITTLIIMLKESGTKHIAIMSLPVIGEDLSHPVNLKADKYSEAIEWLAESYDIDYLPLRERQKEYLLMKGTKPKYAYEDTDWLVYYGIVLHYLLRQSFDKISRILGFHLVTDNLHQNGTSAQMIADLVGGFLAKYSID